MSGRHLGELRRSETFREAFPPRMREQGEEYFLSGRVRKLERTGHIVESEVHGKRPYLVVIDLEDRAWPGECDCQAYERFACCKHIWATMLAHEARFAEQAATGPADRRPQWNARLSNLTRQVRVQRADPWAGIDESRARVEYVMVQQECQEVGAPVLRLVLRKLKTNGRWGTPQSLLPLLRRGAAELAGEDQRLLSLLVSIDLLTRKHWHDYAAFERSTVELSAPEQCALAFPEVARSGRLIFFASDRREAKLEWDDGPPWRLALRIVEENGWAVRGRLERDGEVMALEEPELLFAAGFLVARRKVARFDPRGALAWAVELRGRGEVRAPQDGLAELERTLEECGGEAWIGSGAATSARGPAVVRPVAHAAFEAPRDLERNRVPCRVEFDYGGERPTAPEDAGMIVVRRRDGVRVRRDLAFEREALREILAAGLKRDVLLLPRAHGTVGAGQLGDIVRTLIAKGWTVAAEGKLYRQAEAFRARVNSGVDWFDLSVGVQYGGEVVPLPKLLEAVRSGKREVRLGDGSFGILPEEWLASWGLAEQFGRPSEEGLRFGAGQAWLLDALLAERDDVTTDARFEEQRERLRAFRGIAPRTEPPGFRGDLRPYQREALGWFAFLRDMDFGGCLADDMGLGKTVQVLALLVERRRTQAELPGGRRPTLVVAPRSLVFNWLAEAKRFAPELSAIDFTGTERKERWQAEPEVDLLVTTYATLLRDVEELRAVEFDYVVLDEATAIKNATSLSAKAVRLLVSRHRLALTGTPVENHIGELWSLFEFLNPGMLGRSTAFKSFARTGRSLKRIEDLLRAIRPFFLRRTKGEVLADLPEKCEQIIWCELGREEQRRYGELRDHFRSRLLSEKALGGANDDLGSMKLQVLEALLRLRQCACHLALLDPSLKAESSAKLDELLPRLEQLAEEGHKVLVFSQFTSLLAILREHLDHAGRTYLYLDGQTRDRARAVERFQTEPDSRLFLISLKAGGHGLNLTAADYVFLLDPWWNPAVEAQAVDRAHRMGQTRPVFAYRLIARGTVEEKVLQLQDAKRELAQAVLGGGSSVLRDLTREDLAVLLS